MAKSITFLCPNCGNAKLTMSKGFMGWQSVKCYKCGHEIIPENMKHMIGFCPECQCTYTVNLLEHPEFECPKHHIPLQNKHSSDTNASSISNEKMGEDDILWEYPMSGKLNPKSTIDPGNGYIGFLVNGGDYIKVVDRGRTISEFAEIKKWNPNAVTVMFLRLWQKGSFICKDVLPSIAYGGFRIRRISQNDQNDNLLAGNPYLGLPVNQDGYMGYQKNTRNNRLDVEVQITSIHIVNPDLFIRKVSFMPCKEKEFGLFSQTVTQDDAERKFFDKQQIMNCLIDACMDVLKTCPYGLLDLGSKKHEIENNFYVRVNNLLESNLGIHADNCKIMKFPKFSNEDLEELGGDDIYVTLSSPMEWKTEELIISMNGNPNRWAKVVVSGTVDLMVFQKDLFQNSIEYRRWIVNPKSLKNDIEIHTGNELRDILNVCLQTYMTNDIILSQLGVYQKALNDELQDYLNRKMAYFPKIGIQVSRVTTFIEVTDKSPELVAWEKAESVQDITASNARIADIASEERIAEINRKTKEAIAAQLKEEEIVNVSHDIYRRQVETKQDDEAHDLAKDIDMQNRITEYRYDAEIREAEHQKEMQDLYNAIAMSKMSFQEKQDAYDQAKKIQDALDTAKIMDISAMASANIQQKIDMGKLSVEKETQELLHQAAVWQQQLSQNQQEFDFKIWLETQKSILEDKITMANMSAEQEKMKNETEKLRLMLDYMEKAAASAAAAEAAKAKAEMEFNDRLRREKEASDKMNRDDDEKRRKEVTADARQMIEQITNMLAQLQNVDNHQTVDHTGKQIENLEKQIQTILALFTGLNMSGYGNNETKPQTPSTGYVTSGMGKSGYGISESSEYAWPPQPGLEQKYCPNCGKPITFGLIACPYCYKNL